jgi:integrase
MPFKKNDIKKIRGKLIGRNLAIFNLNINLGLRASELLGLTVNQVKLLKGAGSFLKI